MLERISPTDITNIPRYREVMLPMDSSPLFKHGLGYLADK